MPHIDDHKQEDYRCRECNKLFYGRIDPSWPKMRGITTRLGICLKCHQKKIRSKRHPADYDLPGQRLLFEGFRDVPNDGKEAQGR